jgi:alpha-tubulin suppressor-like RCC1 family protein
VDKDPIKEPVLNTFFTKNKLKVVDVVCDGHHTIVITKSGKTFSFGNGKYENFSIFGSLFARTLCLGHSKSENLNKPRLISALKDKKIKKISTNKHSTLFLDDENKVYVCGRGEWGVNGMGNSKAIQTPIKNTLIRGIIKSLDKPKVLKLVGSSDFSSVLLSNGDVFSFGNNDQGVMGLEKSMGVDMTESISMPQPMFRQEMKVDGKPGFIRDIELGERISIMKVAPDGDKDHKGVLYWGGLKLSSLPERIDFDFDNEAPELISASEKGWAFTTDKNKYC